MSSLPVPLSPCTSTEAWLVATCATVLSMRCIDGWSPMIWPNENRSSRRSRSDAASEASLAFSIARPTSALSASRSSGLVR